MFMKTNNEYPATHSMSTSWFGIDKDGNVALIDFNENGPVPSFLGEESSESVIGDVIPAKITDLKTYISFTDQQAEHLIDAMTDADANNQVEFTNIVQINPLKTEQFISLYDKNSHKYTSKDFDDKLLCLSYKYGIYVLNFYNWKKIDVNTLYEEKILLKSIQFDFWCDENWNEEKGKWIFEMALKNLPFYHYQQPYWPGQLIERTYIPRYPLNESQLDTITKKLAIRFPFSFETQELFQISEYTPCRSYDGGYFPDTESDPLTNRIPYPAFDGGIVRVDENSYPEAMSDTPKIFILDDTQRYIYLHLSRELPFINSAMVFPTFSDKSNPWDRINESIALEKLCELFESNQDRLEKLIATTRPYCIIAMPKSYTMIQKYYKTKNDHILINGTEYPFLKLKKKKKNIAVIERYCSMPYRGDNLNRIVTES